MNIKNSLVSIVIITYNSSKYILETLESAKYQTYLDIELIISDDCSKDNTVQICREWLEFNKERFVLSKVITTPINTGLSANLNRGIKASSGQWIKPIAGDDILVDNAIEEFINFAMISNSPVSISRLLLFYANQEILQKTKLEYDNYFEKILETRKKQLRRIYKELYIPAPGIFFSRYLYNEVNGFDERYPFCEEWPFFYNILKKGYRIMLLDKELVKYRINEGSLCRTGDKMDKRIFDGVKSFFIQERRKQMIKSGMFIQAAKQTVYYYLASKSYETSNNSFTYKYFLKLQKYRNLCRTIL